MLVEMYCEVMAVDQFTTPMPMYEVFHPLMITGSKSIAVTGILEMNFKWLNSHQYSGQYSGACFFRLSMI